MGSSGPSTGAAGPSGHPTSPGWDPDAPPAEVGPAPAQPTPQPSAPTSPPARVLRRKVQKMHPQGAAPAKQAHKRGVPASAALTATSLPSVPAGMGPWCAPWVLLSLPRALKGQTSPPRTVPSSVSQSFQESQVRGWEGGGGGRPSAVQGIQPGQPCSRHPRAPLKPAEEDPGFPP